MELFLGNVNRKLKIRKQNKNLYGQIKFLDQKTNNDCSIKKKINQQQLFCYWKLRTTFKLNHFNIFQTQINTIRLIRKILMVNLHSKRHPDHKAIG